ncbi:acyl-CoA dehydrogenase family protein [Cupriavidus pinatubonensis]|uniref:acyl-CoA dehydrogenase family protein n=1 Tax=Cupriavidus pinatubonensis TaxID=248026 RepID=UPI00361AC357
MFESYRPAWMTDDLVQFRDAVRRFAREQLEPNDVKWREAKQPTREAWRMAGELGMILPDVPEEYGGAGGTAAHAAVVFEEFGYSGNTALALGVGMNHIVAHYLTRYGTEAQKQRWLPGMCSGEVVAAIAMTEPGTGSDLQAVRTRAELRGDSYVVNGAKTFISNGQLCDVVLVVTKTDTTLGAKGISLMLVDTTTPGFRRGKALDKIGMEGQDTSEMFFDDCAVPADSLLGGVEGQGFYQLMNQLPFERAQLAIHAVGAMRRGFDMTVEYVKERKAFGKPIGDFQNTRFVLADIKAVLTASCAFSDTVVQQWIDGALDSVTASMAKFWLTERQGEVMDKCLQFFGGYGYMKEYPIARMYADARVQRIYGGTNEIQRELVGRSL